jgi:membrane associated rhomboid family serine protease
VYRAVPLPGAREISVFELDDAGLVHGITSDSIYVSASNAGFVGSANAVYFVFDPETRQTLYSRKLDEHGLPILGGMLKGADGLIYGIMSRAIYRIDPAKRAFEVLAVPPGEIGSGAAILGGLLYFGIGADLWSYRIPK